MFYKNKKIKKRLIFILNSKQKNKQILQLLNKKK